MFDPRSFTCKERKTVGEILGEILTVDKVVTEKKKLSLRQHLLKYKGIYENGIYENGIS